MEKSIICTYFFIHVSCRYVKYLTIFTSILLSFHENRYFLSTKVTQEKALQYVFNTIKIHLRYNNFSFKGLFSAIVTQETTSLTPFRKQARARAMANEQKVSLLLLSETEKGKKTFKRPFKGQFPNSENAVA